MNHQKEYRATTQEEARGEWTEREEEDWKGLYFVVSDSLSCQVEIKRRA